MARTATYATAINSINPDARIMIDGDITNYDNIQWLENTTPIAKDVLDAKVIECQTALDNEDQSKIDNKASAKAKLMSGEALTQEEADTKVL